jgi:phosphatidylserine/phosphatidylglycerophosphate/cardiolipin synthase-like enzyme
MIETCTGSEITTLMDRVESRALRYREIIICAPYIDAFMAARIRALWISVKRHRCIVRVITSASSADSVRTADDALGRRGDLVVRSRLHAKVYLAIGRESGATEAIITSANLTRAGTGRNIEFGVRIDGTSNEGRNLLRQVQKFLVKTAA